MNLQMVLNIGLHDLDLTLVYKSGLNIGLLDLDLSLVYMTWT